MNISRTRSPYHQGYSALRREELRSGNLEAALGHAREETFVDDLSGSTLQEKRERFKYVAGERSLNNFVAWGSVICSAVALAAIGTFGANLVGRNLPRFLGDLLSVGGFVGGGVAGVYAGAVAVDSYLGPWMSESLATESQESLEAAEKLVGEGASFNSLPIVDFLERHAGQLEAFEMDSDASQARGLVRSLKKWDIDSLDQLVSRVASSEKAQEALTRVLSYIPKDKLRPDVSLSELISTSGKSLADVKIGQLQQEVRELGDIRTRLDGQLEGALATHRSIFQDQRDQADRAYEKAKARLAQALDTREEISQSGTLAFYDEKTLRILKDVEDSKAGTDELMLQLVETGESRTVDALIDSRRALLETLTQHKAAIRSKMNDSPGGIKKALGLREVQAGRMAARLNSLIEQFQLQKKTAMELYHIRQNLNELESLKNGETQSDSFKSALAQFQQELSRSQASIEVSLLEETPRSGTFQAATDAHLSKSIRKQASFTLESKEPAGVSNS